MAERYIMATAQRRIGPDYILLGIVQPLLDGIKLITNDYMVTYRVWDSIYFFFVIILLMFAVVGWTVYCFDS
jgi:NADH:ubiquinone oxidoreductase subunit H